MRVLALCKEELVHCVLYVIISRALQRMLQKEEPYHGQRARQDGCRGLVSACDFPNRSTLLGGRVQSPSRCFLARFVGLIPCPRCYPCQLGSVWAIARLVLRLRRSWREMLGTHRRNACA